MHLKVVDVSKKKEQVQQRKNMGNAIVGCIRFGPI
nr:MAG TPA: hypothetical protein [Bacteriophage sp.]